MRVKLPAQVLTILSTVSRASYEIYIVGGAVRDLLSAKMVIDWDYTTNARPEEIQSLFPDSFYDNRFGTVGIPSRQEGIKPHEITTFRTEHGYSDRRRPDQIQWGTSLQEDLTRRDFTINAMALQPASALPPRSSGKRLSHSSTFTIIDPFDGQKDLSRKLIRAVGDPHERFSEDALRLLRAIRFAAQLGFTIEKHTLNAISTNAPLINHIANERVRDELFKILLSPHPAEGIKLLRNTSLLQEILPEAEKMFGVDQRSPQRHHLYDVGTHALTSLKNCQSQDAITLFATFIHDIGKPATFKKQANNVITFYNHELVGAKIASRIADRLHFSKKQKDKLYRLVRFHQFTVDEHQTDSAVRRFLKNVGLENVEDMLKLRRADRLGGGANETSWRTEEFKRRLIEVQKQPFTVHDLKLSGTEVMEQLNLKPGPQIGRILNQLFEEVVAKKLPNTKLALKTRLKELTPTAS